MCDNRFHPPLTFLPVRLEGRPTIIATIRVRRWLGMLGWCATGRGHGTCIHTSFTHSLTHPLPRACGARHTRFSGPVRPGTPSCAHTIAPTQPAQRPRRTAMSSMRGWVGRWSWRMVPSVVHSVSFESLSSFLSGVVVISRVALCTASCAVLLTRCGLRLGAQASILTGVASRFRVRRWHWLITNEGYIE